MTRIRQFTSLLKSLYAENDFPSERLFRNGPALDRFTEEFNSRINDRFRPEEVAAELERIRKDKKGSGGLPHLGRSFCGPRFAPLSKRPC